VAHLSKNMGLLLEAAISGTAYVLSKKMLSLGTS
jgi:hypothetical protein